MTTILVTGVGAVIGYGVIKSLRALPTRVKIIGTDIYQDAVGQHWCDHFEPAVLACSPKYIDFLKAIIEKHSVDLVIPGIEQDIFRMTTDYDQLASLVCQFALNNFELIKLARDKWFLHSQLTIAGFPTIKTRVEGSFATLAQELGLPYLFKPRRSYASKGIQTISTEDEYVFWKNKFQNNYILQEIIGSDETEYTVGTFGFGDGSCSQKIIFRRKLSGEGATVKAWIEKIPELDNLVDQLAVVFKPVGPTNFQFRYHNNQFLLLEINPRISSSTSLRTAFGYNEASMCIDYYLKGNKPAPQNIRTGYAIRYIEDIINYDGNYL